MIAFVLWGLGCLGLVTELPANDRKKPTGLPQKPKEVKVRPFITDDARVVGERLAQWESWVRIDKESWQHWNLFAYGPSSRLELTTGLVYGVAHPQDAEKRAFSYALPLVQGKFLFREYKPNRLPGVAMVVGTFLPGGRGAFRPAGYGSFGFLTVTQSFLDGDRVLLHGNVGLNYLHVDGANSTLATWGFGTQIRTYNGLHFVGEIFSGDPYVPGAGTSWQVGARHFISEFAQIDATVGQGIGGANPLPFWYSAGVRLVTSAFLKKKLRSGER